MNCPKCQRRLMSTERPEFPDLAVEAHLAACQACRDFQRQLLFVEGNVPRVPVLPASDARARFLQQLLQPASASPAVAGRVSGGPGPRLAGDDARAQGAFERLCARLAGRWHEVGIGLAAAVVLIACGLWLGNRLSGPAARDEALAPPIPPAPAPVSPPKLTNPFKGDKKAANSKSNTLIAKLMECDLKLAEAQTPRQRVEALAELAAVLHRETALLSKSAGPAELNKLAILYKQVIQDGVLPRAQELGMDERKEVLPAVTAQLGKAQRDAEQTAQNSPRSAEALQTIAAAARDGDARLRKMMEEGLE